MPTHYTVTEKSFLMELIWYNFGGPGLFVCRGAVPHQDRVLALIRKACRVFYGSDQSDEIPAQRGIGKTRKIREDEHNRSYCRILCWRGWLDIHNTSTTFYSMKVGAGDCQKCDCPTRCTSVYTADTGSVYWFKNKDFNLESSLGHATLSGKCWVLIELAREKGSDVQSNNLSYRLNSSVKAF